MPTAFVFSENIKGPWPVITSDAGSTGSCWLFTLLIIMGIHMSFLSLLLQDLSKFIFANAPEESCSFVRFLNHPLQIGRRKNKKTNHKTNTKLTYLVYYFCHFFSPLTIFNSVPTFWLTEHLYSWSKKILLNKGVKGSKENKIYPSWSHLSL